MCKFTYAFSAGLYLVFSIASIIVSQIGTPCQVADPSELSLAHWLLGSGSANSIMLPMAFIANYRQFRYTVSIHVVHGLFAFFYSIAGAIIIFRTYLDCVRYSNDMAIMSLLNIILYWILLICMILSQINRLNFVSVPHVL